MAYHDSRFMRLCLADYALYTSDTGLCRDALAGIGDLSSLASTHGIQGLEVRFLLHELQVHGARREWEMVLRGLGVLHRVCTEQHMIALEPSKATGLTLLEDLDVKVRWLAVRGELQHRIAAEADPPNTLIRKLFRYMDRPALSEDETSDLGSAGDVEWRKRPSEYWPRLCGTVNYENKLKKMFRVGTKWLEKMGTGASSGEDVAEKLFGSADKEAEIDTEDQLREVANLINHMLPKPFLWQVCSTGGVINDRVWSQVHAGGMLYRDVARGTDMLERALRLLAKKKKRRRLR